MKKCIICLCLVCTMIFCMPCFAEDISADDISAENSMPSVLLSVNNDNAVFNGQSTQITAPLMIFDKTYVNLYQIANVLNLKIEWVEAYIGYFKVSSATNAVDFTLVSQYDDLINYSNKFFVINNYIYVSLRELADLAGYPLTYNNGIAIVGDAPQNVDVSQIYNNPNTVDSNNYIYKTYPKSASYVVNPYQKYSYENMMADAQKLQDMYPELIKTSSIGKSVEGRDLLLITVGNGPKKIFVCGTHHAREYMATTYLMYAIDRYAYAYRTNSLWNYYSPSAIFDKVTFCFVPMVNPDGVNLVQNGLYATQNPSWISQMSINEGKSYGYASWKANVNGVDVNWNYDKDWSIKRNKGVRGSTAFNGEYPNSEPETRAVSDYVDANAFDAFMSFHTQGQILYYADDVTNPTYLDRLIYADTGFSISYEKAAGVGGSFFDYVYRKYGKATITVELCPYVGNYPYPDKYFDTAWRPAKNILLIVGNKFMYR